MKISRREFLKIISILSFVLLLKNKIGRVFAKEVKPKRRYVMVIDINKCIGCGSCVIACKLENEVPLDAEVYRTWVERYIITKDGKVFIDSIKGGMNAYKNNPIGKKIKKEDVAKTFFVPKLCNQCENPSCVQVCPVGATYKTEDGVVLVDRKWCIGCGYCIQACPYGARFFHPIVKTADKCTFCYHRIKKGLKPACVTVCPTRARIFGDKMNPNDEVYKILKEKRVSVLKPEFGNEPQVFYIGLSKEVR